jgi:hypothetical protein
MSGLVEIVKNYCLSLATSGETTTRQRLRGVIGRGGFGPKLVRWLENSREVFPETVRIEYPENINDRGVDVYIEGQQSRTGVGFQIKSDNDLRDTNFLPNLKRQVTEARAYANLKLYIIVLACSPNHYGRIQYALNEELNQWQAGVPEVLLLVPGKAASLYEACETPLTANDLKVLLRDRSWHRFFAEVGEERDNEFLNHWSGLNPDERFVPPENLKRIEESLTIHPLTVLAGPPTIGKTYTAVQLLYQHFRTGRPIQWIKPPGQNIADFIVAPVEAAEGFSYRIRAMARQLGMRPPDLPRNRWEFIAARLQPGALILIEDPFGRTDAEYENSIHTYDFFDLEGCVEGILELGIDKGCRLLMTTRHGLLDRWRAQRRDDSLGITDIPTGMNIIHIGPDNYQAHRSDGKGSLFELSKCLLKASGKADDSQAVMLADIITDGVKTPQEVELIIGTLPIPASHSNVYAAKHNTPKGALKRIASLCCASTDAERLFLFLLMLSGKDYEHNDFASVYARLHTALLLPSNAAIDDAAARSKYWLLYYPNDYTSSNTTYAGGVPLRWGLHLTPSHSSVVEAIHHEIIENGKGFLNHLVSALKHLEGYQQAATYKKMLVAFLVDFLIDESRHLDESCRLDEKALEELAAALPSTIEISYTLFHDLTNSLLRHWDYLPPVIQTAFMHAVREGDPRLAAWACYLFRYMGIKKFDPWYFYDVLVQQQKFTMGVGGFIQPWYHFVSYLDQSPPKLREVFDSMAISEPSRFAYVIGSLASVFWEKFPQQWKEAILSDHAENSVWLEEPAALENIYSGLFDGDREEPPSELLDLLWHYLDHNNAEFRKIAGTYVLVHWVRLPLRFHDALRERFSRETEMSVVMEILNNGIRNKEGLPDFSLVEILLKRSNNVAAAWLMEILREKNRIEPKAEIALLVERCRTQAGDSIRAFERLELDPATVTREPPLIQVAWIWKQVTGSIPSPSPLAQLTISLPSEQPPASLIRYQAEPPDPLIAVAPFLRDIASGLHGSYAVCAHYIISYQAQKLPVLLQEYLGEVERGEIPFTKSDRKRAKDIRGEVREAILSGRDNYESEQAVGRQSIPAFPIYNLGAAWR